MDVRLLRFTYPPALINEPIIYHLGTEFGLITNIRRANVNKDRGWVILELQGEAADVDRAVRWCQEKGLTVEPVEEDALE